MAAFLHEHLNRRVARGAWEQAIRVPWAVDAPNHGFLLEVDGAVVGAYIAFYSERVIDGRPERLCNLGAWCVVPELRFRGLQLLKALLAQPGYTFTDLSPSGAVVPLNTRLHFEFLDTTTAIVPLLPWPTGRGGLRVTSDPTELERRLTGADRQLYRDHVGAAAARHLLVEADDEQCYVMYRRDRRKRMPLFVSILHVSDPDVFHRASRKVWRHLLLRERAVACLAELRVVQHRPRPSVVVEPNRRKMFRSAHLQAAQIDYCYSELVCVSW